MSDYRSEASSRSAVKTELTSAHLECLLMSLAPGPSVARVVVADLIIGGLRAHRKTVAAVDRVEMLGQAMETVRDETDVISVDLLPPTGITGRVETEFSFDLTDKPGRIVALIKDMSPFWEQAGPCGIPNLCKCWS
jgi:hypothetical protein